MSHDKDIEEIKNPKEHKIVVHTKSVLVSRMIKSNEEDEYKSTTLRFFNVNNPHKSEQFPTKIIHYSNTEKVRLIGLNMSYYLEGNDIVINDLTELTIEHEGNKIYLTGKQEFINRRDQ